jgi:hypothetical protein
VIKLAGHEVFLVGRGALVIGGTIILLALVGLLTILDSIVGLGGMFLLALILCLALLGVVKRLTRKTHF